MTRVHRALAALIVVVAVAAIVIVAAVTHAAPARPTPTPTPVAAGSTDDAHLIRAAALRVNRDHHRAVLAHARAVAAARARAAYEARQRAAAAQAARRAAAASYAPSSAGIPAVWMRVANCEAPGQLWRTNTGNGYYGAFQIEWGNARHYGFRRPDLEPPLRQLALARLILRDQGVGAWPICGPRAGLQRGD